MKTDTGHSEKRKSLNDNIIINGGIYTYKSVRGENTQKFNQFQYLLGFPLKIS